MRYLLTGITAAIAVIIINPVWAQAPPPGTYQPQWQTAPYSDYGWRFVARTPSDAYRQGLINRWELEQLEGPTPQALQGPTPNGDKGTGRGF